MGRADAPALRGTWLGTAMRLLNPVMRRLLGSPFHWPLSRWFMLLSWTGRRTGRRYTTPVSYVARGADIYVTTGDGWWKNLLDAPDVSLRLGGRSRTGRATPIIDAGTSHRDHDRLFRERPFFRRLAGIPTTRAGLPDGGALERSLRAGRTLVRIDVSEPSQGGSVTARPPSTAKG